MKNIVRDESVSIHNHEAESESVTNKKLFSNQLKRKSENELGKPSKVINRKSK